MSEHAPELPLRDSAAPHPGCSCRAGCPDDDQVIHVDVILRPGDDGRAMADRTLRQFERTHPLKRTAWTEEQLADLLGPDAASVERVRRFASAHGLEVVDVCRARRDVTLVGPVSRFNAAFGIRLANYAAGSELFRSHEEEIRVPAGLLPIVDSVLGLDEAPLHHCLSDAGQAGQDATPQASHPSLHGLAMSSRDPHSSGSRPFVPPTPRSLPVADFAAYYGFPAGLDGSGQRVAVFSFGGGFHEQDLRQLGIDPGRVCVVSVDGRANEPLDTATLSAMIQALEAGGPPRMMQEFSGEQARQFAATLEATMDLQLIGLLAPGAQLDAWFIASGARAYRHALHAAMGLPVGVGHAIQPPDRRADIVSISWGSPECVLGANKLRGLAVAFQLAALRGVTVCAASGDFGARGTNPALQVTDSANVVFPASSPYVLACGGSSVQLSEAAGGDGGGDGGGGGGGDGGGGGGGDGDDGGDGGGNGGPASGIQGERVWNSSRDGIPMASGGGWSGLFERPEYQRQLTMDHRDQKAPPDTWGSSTLPGPGAFVTRGVPDVAANADPLRGYSVWLGGRPFISAGTSAATPVWAALVARMNQRFERPLGWFNAALYSSPARATFQPILEGDNDVTGGQLPFYSAGAGWNACAGLGTPHGQRLMDQLEQLPAEL